MGLSFLCLNMLYGKPWAYEVLLFSICKWPTETQVACAPYPLPWWYQRLAWKIVSLGCPSQSSSGPLLCLLCNPKRAIPHCSLFTSLNDKNLGTDLRGHKAGKWWSQDSKVACLNLILVLSFMSFWFLQLNCSQDVGLGSVEDTKLNN
jgi:hypothetical protein